MRSPLQCTMTNIKGTPVDLSKYLSRVVVIVNTASECGYTPQYRALQKLYDDYQSMGLTILGFPSNDFGNQEPLTNPQVAQFCETQFGVKFPMFAKVHVKGDNISDLYKLLTTPQGNPKHHGPVAWNFEKFVIGRNGQVNARFSSAVDPLSETFIETLMEEIDKQPILK